MDTQNVNYEGRVEVEMERTAKIADDLNALCDALFGNSVVSVEISMRKTKTNSKTTFV